MISSLTKLIILQALFLTLYSIKGIEVVKPLSAPTFQCIRNNGIIFSNVRGMLSSGTVDPNAVPTLQAAKSAGLLTNIIMFPCRGKSATAQVNELFSSIPSSLFGTVWIDL